MYVGDPNVGCETVQRGEEQRCDREAGERGKACTTAAMSATLVFFDVAVLGLRTVSSADCSYPQRNFIVSRYLRTYFVFISFSNFFTNKISSPSLLL